MTTLTWVSAATRLADNPPRNHAPAEPRSELTSELVGLVALCLQIFLVALWDCHMCDVSSLYLLGYVGRGRRDAEGFETLGSELARSPQGNLLTLPTRLIHLTFVG